jgi:hypothetical protein
MQKANTTPQISCLDKQARCKETLLLLLLLLLSMLHLSLAAAVLSCKCCCPSC